MDHKCEGLIAPHRRFIYEGDVYTHSISFCNIYEPELSDELHCMRLFLFNDLIVIAKKRQTLSYSFGISGDQLFSFKEKLELNKIVVGLLPSETDQDEGSFFIRYESRCPDRFYCKITEQVDHWVKIINETKINESKRASVYLERRKSTKNLTADNLLSISFPSVPSVVHETPIRSSDNKLINNDTNVNEMLQQGKLLLKDLFISISKVNNTELQQKIKVS